jgi:hypothetical protein
VAGRVYPQAEPPTAALPAPGGRSEEEAGAAPLAPNRTLPPIDVSLDWAPLAWRYADAAGHLDDLAPLSRVPGRVEGNTIIYAGVMPGVNESYQVVPNGLRHQLTLLAPPRLPDPRLPGDTTLDYVGIIQLPAGLDLYADGALQKEDFTTAGPIQVRDGEGHLLLDLKPPFAYEAQDRKQTVRGSYRVWREAGELHLAWRTPAAWLLDPERRYPVVLDPTAFIRPAAQDAGIYEQWPTSNYGSDEQLTVGRLSTPAYLYRSLVQWTDFSPIPAQAVIGTCDSCGQVVMYVTGREGGESDQRLVGLYPLTTSWIEGNATWNARTSASDWSSPGGDYDTPELASASIGSSYGSGPIWFSATLRDMAALWRTNALLGTSYGTPNYGLLIRYSGETGDQVKRFASKEHASLGGPELRVIYYAGPRNLAHQTPDERRVPSPDYHATPAVSNLWQAVGIRVDNPNSDYNLRLYEDASYTTQLALSGRGAGEVEFVTIDRQAPSAARYALTYSYNNSETGNYRIEYVEREAYLSADGIDPEDSFGPYTIDASGVLRVYSFAETAGARTCIAVNPTSGDAQLGMAVFVPGSAPNDYYFPRKDALSSAIATGAGGSVSLYYLAPASGRYGLVVWKQGSGGTTNYVIEGCTIETLFLPLTLRNA